MPTLGFLKKKRTREGNTDPSSASNPTSPVTPTAAQTFDYSTISPAASSYAQSQAGSRPATSQQPNTQADGGALQQPGMANPNQPQHSLNAPQQPFLGPPPGLSSTPSPMTVPQGAVQNPLTISNLVNNPQGQIPQYDGTAGYPGPQATPGMQYTTNPAAPGQQPGSIPLGQQPPAQFQQPTLGQAPQDSRVTKGKYSLGDFQMLRTLGTGSFGRVHLVQSRHNQRFYAVKVLKKAQVVKMKQVEHTNDERRMLGEVKHPFLITLWGTFQDSRNLYMVMDFVEGGELFSLLRKSGRFPNPVAKFYAAEVTLALEYLHSKNIIYRDLKPENLLLDRHGHLKITDFGFAKRVVDKTWTLCGTPDYLAPEVVSNRGYNKSVDWWSLGILIFEMLCGYTPFWDGGSPMRIYENILKGKVKYPSFVNPDAQDLLEQLITADLTKRLGNLYGGAQDVKNHVWFAEVTWDRLARKDIDAPYLPPVKAGAGDASQFDRYPEETEGYGATGPDEHEDKFRDF